MEELIMKALPMKVGRSLLLVSLILLTGCQGVSPTTEGKSAEPTQNLDTVRTEAVQTAIAAITVTAESMPTATATTTVIPSDTPVPATATPVASLTAAPSATSTRVVYSGGSGWVPTKTVYTDTAKLTAQTPADNKSFTPGEDFDITWTFQNVGLRPWNTQFYFNYVSGPTSQNGKNIFVSRQVAVNDTYSFTVDMEAPTTPGIYVCKWGLINDDGVTFFSFYYSFAVTK
jgi:methionine-rich copper-binding protein CopC